MVHCRVIENGNWPFHVDILSLLLWYVHKKRKCILSFKLIECIWLVCNTLIQFSNNIALTHAHLIEYVWVHAHACRLENKNNIKMLYMINDSRENLWKRAGKKARIDWYWQMKEVINHWDYHFNKFIQNWIYIKTIFHFLIYCA